MTVAEAINRKQTIELDKKLLAKIEGARRLNINRMHDLNVKATESVEQMLKAYNNQTPQQIEETKKSLLSSSEYSLVDPLNSEKLIQEIFESVEEFESNVDAALSESNAITFIEI